jgi:NAD(P)-dependent dehydrogenase (short-subunit alcohol dehydrogenase family)
MNTNQTPPHILHHDFRGKVVVITGGGSGIGAAAAKAMHAAGAAVVINGRRQEVLNSTAREIAPHGERILTVAGDIAEPNTAVKIVEAAQAAFGGVDILINNAGIFTPKPFLEHTPSDFDRFIGTILRGKFFMAQAAAKAMKLRDGGAIVHIGSMWAERAVAATPSSAYSAANAGVHALVRNLAVELAPSKIRINAIAPAVVETPVYGTFLSPQQVKDTLPTFNAFHPLGRIGQPEDIVGAILFLASPAAGWITGTILPVDGGVMASR